MRLESSPFQYFQITGDDRLEWLQGQCSQDLRQIGPDEWKRTALLTATGQMASDGGVWVFDDNIILGLDRYAAASAIESLRSRIIMEDVSLGSLPQATTLISSSQPDGLCLPVEHILGPCFDIFENDSPAEALVSPSDYNILRVEAAIPIFGLDYDSKTLAMELGEHFIETRIAFDKGCYTGQEVVERIRSRGHTNRQWVGLSSTHPVDPGASAKVTSYALSPRFGHIALAFVPTGHAEPGTRLGNAVVRPIPFT